ncbi:hypothetical protein A6A08_07290 [Nocardiopsis sp. TSRI0078]|uniref:hypothetical protein n=1 Tax=unclassified Nocardiopsis TaxID=2649073 RepID=UPI00093DCCFD|nr:hypothetical protein [Nocardiopsis sp. TSRI0078]OKI17058.1 hypothetical protein A6A08_07290 [Nocardiopsis sp. TSRI0078]
MLSSRARALLSALLNDLPGRHHILTLHTRHAMSTAVARRGEGFDVEHPPVVERLCDALADGATAAVVLRSLTDQVSHTLPDGVGVPVKLVRGWSVVDRDMVPLDEARMFDAHCTDAASGEPVPPERGVVYADAPAVDLTVFRGV